MSKSLNNDAGGNSKSKNNVYDSVENDSLKVLVSNPFLLLLLLYDWFLFNGSLILTSHWKKSYSMYKRTNIYNGKP